VPHLSKSRFTTGYQCEKLLWWTVHEPDATELQPDKVLQDLFDQGRQVGELARRLFPGGVLIDHPHKAYADRIASTQQAILAKAPAIFEASFSAGGVFVAVDVLLQDGDGWTLIEVKATNSVKEEHTPDAAIQTWVLRQAGIPVTRVELLHLNSDFRHPSPGNLLVREDITDAVEAFLPEVPGLIERLARVLEGPLPDKPLGLHCYEPRECPFHARCWPDDPLHIRHLYNVGPKRTVAYFGKGIHSIGDLPPSAKLGFTERRQLRALREGRLVVEPSLAAALQPFEGPLGYLDFETVARAVPVWDGTAPWGAAVAQFSYHEEQGDGTHRHTGWLAEGPGDPRRELAERMISATRGARHIVTYSSYEKSRLRDLVRLVPELAAPLEDMIARLVDLLPVVRNHVYHPEFRGSFSLKYVLTPLCPSLSYSDLVIVDGRVASVEIARLLFHAHKIPPAERDRVRQDLLDYCERDTWATVRLMARLRELAGR
jgi:predicted RecB family nuclease